jgi:histidinol-phosphate aminotransferase
LWADEADHFQHSQRAISARLSEEKPRLVFICNPNNPTGVAIPLDVITGWTMENSKTLFVVDEAYLKFVPDLDSALTIGAPNLLVLASMTKDYAIAGLRLGYAVGHAEVVDALVRVRLPWNVNALALAAGQAALADGAYLKDTLQKLRQARATLFSGLQGLGFPLIPSQTHYCLLRVSNGAFFRSRLLHKGIQVRDCASFGLPGFVRIATRKSEENQKLLDAIKELGL